MEYKDERSGIRESVTYVIVVFTAFAFPTMPAHPWLDTTDEQRPTSWPSRRHYPQNRQHSIDIFYFSTMYSRDGQQSVARCVAFCRLSQQLNDFLVRQSGA